MTEHHPDHIHLPHVPERDIRIVFWISLALKALNAALETILGLVLLFSSGVTSFIIDLINREVLEDPNGFFATHLSGLAAHLSLGAQIYGAIYLLSHGIVKIFLVWGLYRDRLWAYPTSLTVFALFTIYQIVEIIRTHSVFMIVLTIFNLLVIWLIWHEYKYHLRRHHERVNAL